MDRLRRQRNNNVLLHHSREFHPLQPLGREDVVLEVTSNHTSALTRQAEEGTRIMMKLTNDKGANFLKGGEGEERMTVLMNSKREFHQPPGAIRTATTYL